MTLIVAGSALLCAGCGDPLYQPSPETTHGSCTSCVALAERTRIARAELLAWKQFSGPSAAYR